MKKLHLENIADSYFELNKIFYLEKEIILKDTKIAILEFELALQRQLNTNLSETRLNFSRI